MMGIAALNPSCGLARRFLENAGNQDVQSASGRNARIAPDFLNRATLLTNRATICSNRATNWRDSSIRTGDRKSVVEGKSVSVRVDLGGRRIIKNTNRDKRDVRMRKKEDRRK